ncbi:MAG TPA: 30S ribosomal protein S1 [Candidatus Limnocylindrales bacterium]
MSADKQGGTTPADEASDATAKATDQPVPAAAADEPATSETIDAITEEAVGEAVSEAEEAVAAEEVELLVEAAAEDAVVEAEEDEAVAAEAADEAAVDAIVAEVAVEVALEADEVAVAAVDEAADTEAVAVEATERARAADAVAEIVLEDGEVPAEVVGEVVIQAVEAEEVADEAAAEAYLAHEVADEAVGEAVMAEAVAIELVEEADEAREVADETAADAYVAEVVAEEAVETAVVAEVIAEVEEAEATDAALEAGDAIAASLAGDDLADAPAAEAEPARDLGPEPTTMEELLNEQTGDIRSFKHGDVVEGTVVRIDKDEILVDIGAKSEGVVSNRELYGRNAESQPSLDIGDTVLVYVLQPESNEGHAVLSLRRAGLERKWRSMQEQFDAGVIIEAPVIDHNKGGLIVDCGIRGFVPISQIVDFPRRPQNDQPRDAAQEIAEKLQPFVGRKMRLKILEVNRKANRLILSEKVALYEERREKRDELFSSLQVGQKVTGTVRSIAPFGVFIDLGGIDGLVHKSELSWNKVNNPEAGYSVGDEVEAEVIDINHERGRISLSIRRLQPDPWHSTVADFKVGDIIDGTVTKIVNFGAFVRVREGLEGLIHISELSHQRVAHPGDVVHEGQVLKLKIISLDSERHRLGLSLKQAEEPPARSAPEAREPRRPRPERSFDSAQAVQEPEGGIDNTLAAAFAQVRQQMAASEVGEIVDEVRAEEAVEEAVAAEAIEQIVEAVAEDEAAVEAVAVMEIEALEDAAAANEDNEAAVEEAEAEVVAEVVAIEAAEEEVAAEAIEEIVEAVAEDEADLEADAADTIKSIADEVLEENTAG